MRLDVVNLSAEGAAQLDDSGRLPASVLNQWKARGQGRTVQSLEMLTVSDTDAVIHLGRQHGLVYYDPKAGHFMIQFVDTGVKMSVRSRIGSGGKLQIETRSELSAPMENSLTDRNTDRPEALAYPQSALETVATSMGGIAYGDTVVVAHAQGAFVGRLLSTLPGSPSPSHLGNHLLFLLTPMRP